MVPGTEAQAFEAVGETVGPLVELAIGQPGVTPDHDLAIGDPSGDALEQICQVELHGLPLPPGRSSANEIPERHILVDSDVMGKPQHPLADDVALHLVAPGGDPERRCSSGTAAASSPSPGASGPSSMPRAPWTTTVTSAISLAIWE